MSLLQLLALLRRLDIRSLLAYPTDLTDAEAVRKWLLAVLEAFDALADLTDTTVDDRVVDAIRMFVEDPVKFKVLHDVLMLFIDKPDAQVSMSDDTFANLVCVVEDETGFNPAMILAIIQIVLTILRAIRERRNG